MWFLTKRGVGIGKSGEYKIHFNRGGGETQRMIYCKKRENAKRY
jgi:hypothetical protein